MPFNKDSHFDVAAWAGDRSGMEDRFVVEEKALFGSKLITYGLVFDGHGGAEAASFCADNFKQILQSHIRKISSIPSALQQSINSLHRQWLERNIHQEPVLISGTTVCGVLIDHQEDILYFVNMGDSRARFFRVDPSTQQLVSGYGTQDQTGSSDQLWQEWQEKNKDKCKYQDMYVLSLKDKSQVMPTRVIGDHYAGISECVLRFPRIDAVDLRSLPAEFQHVVIATDGFWEIADHLLSEAVPLNSFSAKYPAMSLLQYVCQSPNSNDDFDNICVVVLGIPATSKEYASLRLRSWDGEFVDASNLPLSFDDIPAVPRSRPATATPSTTKASADATTRSQHRRKTRKKAIASSTSAKGSRTTKAS